MPHPFVTTATVKDDLIEITVEFDYSDSGTYVEVSGSATQSGGAFANFYDIAETTPGLTGPTGAFPTVNVSAHPLPPNNFRKDEDVTFVIRVSKVWLTVLGPQGSTTSTEDPGVPADQGTTWNVVRKQSHLDDDDDGGTGDAPDGAGAPQTAAAGR
jgi:hypothetical protein